MAVVVSDTSPLIALGHLGRVTLLHELFGHVLIPPAVAGELQADRWGTFRQDILGAPFISIRQPLDQRRIDLLLKTLDRGEAEALALAVEVGASTVLIDESIGRSTARQMGLRPVGVVGVLAEAKNRGLISYVAPEIDRLKSEIGFHISESLRREVLRRVGEAD